MWINLDSELGFGIETEWRWARGRSHQLKYAFEQMVIHGHAIWGEVVTITILYMFTIYTLLLIELWIIGNRIWHFVYIRNSFSIRKDTFGHSMEYPQQILHLSSSFSASLCQTYSIRYCVCLLRSSTNDKRKCETIDKCWFAALIRRSAWVWHGFTASIIYELRHFFGIWK